MHARLLLVVSPYQHGWPHLDLQVFIVPVLLWTLVVDICVHPGNAGSTLVSAPISLAVPGHDDVAAAALLPLSHSTASQNPIMLGEST